MTPVVQSVDHLHNEIWKLSESMDSASQEIVTMKQTLNISALSGSSSFHDALGEPHLQRPPLKNGQKKNSK